MDLATLIGLGLGVALLVASILMSEGASFGAFVDVPSLMVVVGGAFAATMISMPLKNFLAIGGVGMKIFMNKPPDVPKLIEQIVSLAEVARREGLLALESRMSEIDNPFLALGLQMAVDGTPQEVVESVMRTEIQAVASRHKQGKFIFDSLGRYGPAFGMIGTLMGLIIMLGNMSDPSSIGSGMAVALITTLYGAIFSNLFCLPFADKLGVINNQELESMEIILQGVLAIQAGENPRMIQQKLATYIPPKLRNSQQQEAA